MGYHTIEEYHKAIKLYKEGLTLTQISRVLNIPRSTPRDWIQYGKEPRLLFNIENNTRMWPYLAYLYGAIMTDGYIFRGERKTWLEISGEKIFLDRISKTVQKLIKKTYKISKDKKSDRYIIRITNRELFNLVSKTFSEIKKIIEHDNSTIRAFIIGIVDGDGYVRIPRRSSSLTYVGFSTKKKIPYIFLF